MSAALKFTGPRLRAAEVDRHSVRMMVIPRAVNIKGPSLEITPFAALPDLLRSGDLVVVNDAATLPASLPGRTAEGAIFELRLSGPVLDRHLQGILFGAGDYHTRTEERAAPPPVNIGAQVFIAGMSAKVTRIEGRRVELELAGEEDALWQLFYSSGAPIQYAYRPDPLPLWSVQTAYAARPWAAEMPSAGRPLTWEIILGLRRKGIAIASLTHAASLSSTGDESLDRALPWPEQYELPERTAEAVHRTRAAGGRIIAIGTSVVRALEASRGQAGTAITTLRLDANHRLRIADGIVSGLHAPGESHFDLLSAFAPAERLRTAIEVASEKGLSGHELGDACLIV